jgi:mannose-6-phosphate isomerase
MLYPLRLKPLLQRYLWGGRRLETLLGKSLGEGDDYAESWEAVDHQDGQSVVLNGPLAGLTLRELMVRHAAELLGRHAAGLLGGQAAVPRFPLLFKFLDAQKTLSVQVHPNDVQAALQMPPDLGKTEAWVVLAAEPGAKIYAGLTPGTTREVLAAALDAGTCEERLHVIEPHLGDCVFIPAGTVHALGAGLVIAEIQQASNTTFRLFDFNRLDKHGKSRPLHIAESLAVTDFARGPVSPQRPVYLSDQTERLVACDKFVLDRHTLHGTLTIPADNRFHLLAVIGGEVKLRCGDFTESLSLGTTVLLPASRAAAIMVGGGVVLDMYLP